MDIMTFEVAMLNQKGVAIAADSAMTIDVAGQPKVFPSANKLYWSSPNFVDALNCTRVSVSGEVFA